MVPVGNVILTLFEFDNPPPPAGSASSAANLLTIPGISFFEAADYYLVAYAHAHGDVVVTHETPAPQAKKVKLPTACIGVGVKTMNPWEMLRREKVRFVLEQPVAERPQPGGAEGQAEVAPRVPQDDTSGVAAFFGTWPGDESDAELLEALGETK